MITNKLKKTVVSVLKVYLMIFSMTSLQAKEGFTMFVVDANILTSCVVSAQDLSFNDVDLAEGAESQSIISVTCPGNTTVNITLDSGENQLGSQKRLNNKLGSIDNYVNYNLYSNASKTAHFDQILGGLTTVTSGSEEVLDVIVYGEIPIQESQPSGIYSDIVGVTVNY